MAYDMGEINILTSESLENCIMPIRIIWKGPNHQKNLFEIQIFTME